MKYTETYICSTCGWVWAHEYNTEDYNNDYTICPCCNDADFNFNEISEEEYYRLKLVFEKDGV